MGLTRQFMSFGIYSNLVERRRFTYDQGTPPLVNWTQGRYYARAGCILSLRLKSGDAREHTGTILQLPGEGQEHVEASDCDGRDQHQIVCRQPPVSDLS